MTLTEFFEQVNLAYRGSDDDVPESGSPDYTLWLGTANRKMYEWARDGKQAWRSLFSVNNIGTVSAGTQSYDLDETLLIPSDRVKVTTTGGSDIYYTICEPQERDRYKFAAYISGFDPQVLTFYDTIASDSNLVDGTIYLAGYWLPDALANSGDTIPVDDPYWLVYAVASELAFNDITYEDKYVDLNTKANNLYSQMASNNRRGTSNYPRAARTNVNSIKGVRSALKEF